MTPIIERKCARFYIQKSKKIAKRLYIYTKIQTLFKKQDNLCYIFIHKKPDTLRYAIFMKFLKLEFTVRLKWIAPFQHNM